MWWQLPIYAPTLTQPNPLPSAFLDSNLLSGMGRMLRERRPQPPQQESKKWGKQQIFLRRKRANVCRKLREVLSEWRLNGLHGDVCKRSCALYDALVYKFGKSNRRQRFWRLVRQIYSELKRINARKMVRFFDKFVKVGRSLPLLTRSATIAHPGASGIREESIRVQAFEGDCLLSRLSATREDHSSGPRPSEVRAHCRSLNGLRGVEALG